MRTLFALCFFSFATIASFGQEQPILVSAQWLKEHQSDPKLVILQTSFLQFEYDNEHIAGAQHLWPGWLAPDSPKGSFNAPDPTKATEALQRLGINKDSHIVLCHMRNEVSATARMFLTLEHFGLRGQVSFLNGGLEAWKKEGYPVTKEVPAVKKGNFKVKSGTLLVDKDYVLQSMKTPGAVIVDARMKNYYDGDPTGNPRDGHIAGAKNIPYPDLLDAANFNQFKPTEQLAGYFTPVIPDKSSDVVTYCFIGQTASVVYMAGRILGYNMKLYDGSMQEWSRLDNLPMEKTQK